MHCIEWWHFQWPWMIPNYPVSTFCIAFHIIQISADRDFKSGTQMLCKIWLESMQLIRFYTFSYFASFAWKCLLLGAFWGFHSHWGISMKPSKCTSFCVERRHMTYTDRRNRYVYMGIRKHIMTCYFNYIKTEELLKATRSYVRCIEVVISQKTVGLQDTVTELLLGYYRPLTRSDIGYIGYQIAPFSMTVSESLCKFTRMICAGVDNWQLERCAVFLQWPSFFLPISPAHQVTTKCTVLECRDRYLLTTFRRKRSSGDGASLRIIWRTCDHMPQNIIHFAIFNAFRSYKPIAIKFCATK